MARRRADGRDDRDDADDLDADVTLVGDLVEDPDFTEDELDAADAAWDVVASEDESDE